MKILVINSGSSSVKYQVIDMENEGFLAKGQVERIGLSDALLCHQSFEMPKFIIKRNIKDHTEAMNLILMMLTDKKHGIIKNISEINAVGHRIAHGGPRFTESVRIDDDVVDAIRAAIPLSPIHNPANIMGIEACRKLIPGTPMAAVFDTTFHQKMPEKAFLYGIPYEFFQDYNIRRYGFHGISHRYLYERARAVLGRSAEGLSVITCHLGNGSSIAAIKDGISIDTSMGMTPLEGIMMGTRCGDIDPAIIGYLIDELGFTLKEVVSLLNKKSGLLGISGVSSDMRDLMRAANNGGKRAQLAIDMFCYRIRKYIGAYAAAMGGLDAVIFSAGIGEKSAIIRRKSVEGLEFLGVSIDEKANENIMGETDISFRNSSVKIYVIPTNEELMIAREANELLFNK